MALKKTGDWLKSSVVLRRLHVTLNAQARRKLERDANALCEMVKTTIETGDVSPPNKDYTLEKKYPEDRPWIETYKLLDSIRVYMREERSGALSAFIGVSNRASEDRTSVRISQVAEWLEFGNPTNGQPPRPVFYPVSLEAQKNFMSSWKKLVGDTIILTANGKL